MHRRRGRVKWGPNGTRSKTSVSYWKQPLKWNREAKAAGERQRVFCGSLCDVFEDWDGPIVDHNGKQLSRCDSDGCGKYYTNEFLDSDGHFICDCCRLGQRMPYAEMNDLRRDLFSLIDATPNLDWLLLSKRPENAKRFWPKVDSQAHYWNLKNVWLGTSISDQQTADEMVPRLLENRDLAAKLFLSVEPLLGPVDLRLYDLDDDQRNQRIDWVIVGGESGPNARQCNVEWICSIVEQCKEAGVACFTKQLGSKPYERAGQFFSFTEWVNKASSWIGGKNAVCIDAVGRSCKTGKDFSRARDECTFPVNYSFPLSKAGNKKGDEIAEWPEDLRVREIPA